MDHFETAGLALARPCLRWRPQSTAGRSMVCGFARSMASAKVASAACEVNALRLQPLGVALELRGELRPQQPLHPHGVEHLFRRGIARALLRDDLLRLADGLQRLVVGLGVLEAQGNPLLALDLLVEGAGDGRDVEAEVLGYGARGPLLKPENNAP